MPVPGPVPKRKAVRRRRNRSDGDDVDTAPGAKRARAPRPDPKWHPIAKAWLNGLARSGQSAFYQPSDWATARLIAESISRDLQPQFVGFEEGMELVDDVPTPYRKPVMASLPLKGASLAAYLKGMTALLGTEGDRRRLRLELEQPGPTPAELEDPKVARMSDHARRFAG